jgi:hypothetical protein
MDLSKMTTGQKIILGGGVLLIINLFLPWYRVSVMGFSASINAFDTFLAWFGSFCAIAGAVIIALKMFGNVKIAAGPLKAEHLALALAALGFVLILLRLITETSSVFIGIFIGLIATAGMTYGGFLAMKDEGMALQDFKSLGGGKGGNPPPPPPPA